MSKSIRLLRRLDKMSFFGLISMEMAVIFIFFVSKKTLFLRLFEQFFCGKRLFFEWRAFV